jgi:hypothetical protein
MSGTGGRPRVKNQPQLRIMLGKCCQVNEKWRPGEPGGRASSPGGTGWTPILHAKDLKEKGPKSRASFKFSQRYWFSGCPPVLSATILRALSANDLA